MLSVYLDSNIACVVVYHNFTGEDVEVSIVSVNPKWKKDRVLEHLFGYPFRQLKTNRLTTRIKADNQPAIRLVKKLGFKQEGTLREALDNEDVLIFGMLKRECKYGQEISRITASGS